MASPLAIPILSGVLDIGGKLIERVFPDPTQRAKAELELLKMQQSGELAEMSSRMSAIVAEAQSQDPWTSRARPSFLYVFYMVILSLVIVAPIIGVFTPGHMEAFFTNVTRGFSALPDELWWTFTAGYLGYAGFRTYEKRVVGKQ